MVLSRKEKRKLNKSLKTTTQSPTKSIPIPRETTNEPFPAIVELPTHPLDYLFTPQSPAELQLKVDTVSDLITSARSVRAGSDATTSTVTYIPPAFDKTRRDSVLDIDDDDNKRQSLRFSTQELVASIVDNTCANDADVSNFDVTESYRSDSFGYMSDCGNLNHSKYQTFSSRPIDIERASRSSSETFTAIPTARPSPTFGFALFRPTKGEEEPPEKHQHSNAQKPISPKPVIINSSPSALSKSVRRPGVGFRSDSTASLIFPLDLQNDDDFEQRSTVRYNPMSGQERASGFSSLEYSSAIPEMQVITKLPDGDVIVEDCSSVGTNSPVSCAWDTGNGHFIPSPSAVESLPDVPLEQRRFGIIQGVNAKGNSCTPAIPALTNVTNDHTVLGSLDHFQLHGDATIGRSTLLCSYDGDYLSPEQRHAETGTLLPPEPTPEMNAGTLRGEPLRGYEHFPLEAPPTRTASRSQAIREGKRPANDATAAFAADQDYPLAEHAPAHGLYHSAEELATRATVRPFPSSNSGRTCENIHVMHDTPPRSDRDSGEEYDISDSIPSPDIGEESDISDYVSSLDIGRPVGAIDADLLARHKKEQREKAAARQAAWEAREDRYRLERELERAVQGWELHWADMPAGAAFHPNDNVASAQTDAKASNTSSNAYCSLSSRYYSVAAPGSSGNHDTSAPQASTSNAGNTSSSTATTAVPPQAQPSKHEEDTDLELLETVKDLSSALAGMTTMVRKVEAKLSVKSRASTLARGQTSASFTSMAGPKLHSDGGDSYSSHWLSSTYVDPWTGTSTEDAIRHLSRPLSPGGYWYSSLAPAATSTYVDPVTGMSTENAIRHLSRPLHPEGYYYSPLAPSATSTYVNPVTGKSTEDATRHLSRPRSPGGYSHDPPPPSFGVAWMSFEDAIRHPSRPLSPILGVADTIPSPPTISATAGSEGRSVFNKLDGPKDIYAHIMPVWLRDEMRKHDGPNVLQLLEPSPAYEKQHPTFPDGTPVPSRLITAESDDHRIPADWKHVVETVLGKPPGEPLTEADKDIIFQLVKEGYIVPPPMSIRPDVWTHEGGDDVPEGSTRAVYTPGWHIKTREDWMVCLRAFEDLHKNGGEKGESAGN